MTTFLKNMVFAIIKLTLFLKRRYNEAVTATINGTQMTRMRRIFTEKSAFIRLNHVIRVLHKFRWHPPG